MVPVPDGGKFMICLIALIMVPEGIPELLVQVWYASRQSRSARSDFKTQNYSILLAQVGDFNSPLL